MTPTIARGLLLSGLLLALAVLAIHISMDCSAQTDPPAFGVGEWSVGDATLVEDDFLMMMGNLTVRSGGELTLRNVTMLFKCEGNCQYGIEVEGGGTLRVLGCTVGSSRPRVAWTFIAWKGSTLRLLDSSIQECGGYSAYRFLPGDEDWNLSLYVNTSDAVIEGCRIEGGLNGLHFPDHVVASPVRNCTFSQVTGVLTSGTAIEDCTFLGHSHYGIRVVGGRVRVQRCRFEGILGSGVHLSGGVVLEDCAFLDCRRGVWAEGACSASEVVRCTFERVNIALSVRNGHVTVADGVFRDCNQPVESLDGSRVDLEVREALFVSGGPVNVSGDISVGPDGTLSLVDCRSLLQWNRQSEPRRFLLGEGATLELVNTTLGPPEADKSTPWVPADCQPLALEGEGAQLSMEGVHALDLAYPVRLRELSCRNSTLTLGEWRVGAVDLQDSVVVSDPLGAGPHLGVYGLGPSGAGARAGTIARCDLEDVLEGGGPGGPWLTLEGGTLRSLDTLWGLASLVEAGSISLPATAGLATLEAHWTARVQVAWQNQVPIPERTVTVTDSQGHSTLVPTDDDGKGLVDDLLTEVALGRDEVQCLLPLVFAANLSGLEGTYTLDAVEGPVDVTVVIEDRVRPHLEVDQGTFVATNVQVLNLTGRAGDEHSGLAFVEVAVGDGEFSRTEASGASGAFRAELVLRQGIQEVTVRAYDWVGNRAVWRLDAYFSTLPPYLIVHQPLDGSWSCSELVRVIGETEPNSTVEVGGRLEHTVDGTFNILVPVEVGENLLTIVSTNLAGNVNRSTVSVLVDTTPPWIDVSHPPASPWFTRDPSEVIEGSTEPGANLSINTVPMELDGEWGFSARTNLDEGATVIVVQAVDQAGNVAEVELVFVLDSIPPLLEPLNVPEGGLRTNDPLLVLVVGTDVVTTKDGAPTGEVLELDGARVESTGGIVQLEVELVEGEQEVTLLGRDSAGNEVEVSRTVWLDTTPPSLVIDCDARFTTSESTLLVAGRAEVGSMLRVNGIGSVVREDGTFDRELLLSEGTNLITVVAVDPFGNEATEVIEVEMVPAAPPPREAGQSLLPHLMGVFVMALVAEGSVLALRRRRRQSRGADSAGRGPGGP